MVAMKADSFVAVPNAESPGPNAMCMTPERFKPGLEGAIGSPGFDIMQSSPDRGVGPTACPHEVPLAPKSHSGQRRWASSMVGIMLLAMVVAFIAVLHTGNGRAHF